MGLDRVDVVAVVGFLGLAGASTVLEGIVIAAAVGGFALSLSSVRLYDGHPWEALAWLAWVGAAVTLVVGPGGVATLVAFVVFLLVGLGFLFAGRLELLPDVWTVPDGTDDEEPTDG